MTKTNQNIPPDGSVYVEGDSVNVKITIFRSDVPMDLEGTEVVFALSRVPGGEPLVKKSLSNGISIVEENNGLIEISINSDDTEGLGTSAGEEYHYEVSLKTNANDTVTVTRGNWTIYEGTISD